MTTSHNESDEDSILRKIRQESAHEASSAILELISDNIRYQKTPNRRILVTHFLKLGLIDELLQLFLRTSHSTGKEIITSIEYFEQLIDNKFYDTLETINPKLKLTTLELVLETLHEELDKDLTINIVCVVFFATNIFLLKLDTSNERLLTSSMPSLELLFTYLAKYLKELPLRASDVLVRATNNLVISVKDKLDALADNATIRENFKTIVETVAEQCLIESRYKGAAMLYSQIEDNVNAIKSLMRAGDVDTVVDFALLVRDITVNRITINYLKHLKVDVKKIEDFITRSKI